MRINFLGCFLLSVFINPLLAQTKYKSDSVMAIISNKEIVTNMYQNVLNQKKIEMLDQFIDSSFTETFIRNNKPLMTAFPDIQFTIKEILEDENRVITLYNWSGTHLYEYQNIPPTNKKITVEGISFYTLKNGKIINSIAKPDKLSFFSQLEIIPTDLIQKNIVKHDWVYFVDEFEIPQEAYRQFKEKLEYNRIFIKKLKGFVSDEVIMKTDSSSHITLMTIAIWENEQSLIAAKKSVQKEYRRINFNPNEFNKNLNIKMKRDIYSHLE